MTSEEKIKTLELRGKGLSYQAIAKTIGVTFEAVRSFLRRQKNKSPGEAHCKNCGSKLTFVPGKMKKKFCSDKCRMTWWNSHQDQVNRKAYYQCVCQFCGKVFSSYGNKDRHYCGRSCFALARKKQDSANG
jgi:rRNA maturation endonuclease Nob1